MWQWVHHGVALDDGSKVSASRVRALLGDELDALRSRLGNARLERGRFGEAARLFEALITEAHPTPFLTLPAYELLITG